MSIAELKAEVSRITDEERKELSEYLAKLDEFFPAEVVSELSAKLNDKNPARWVPLEDLAKHLSP